MSEKFLKSVLNSGRAQLVRDRGLIKKSRFLTENRAMPNTIYVLSVRHG